MAPPDEALDRIARIALELAALPDGQQQSTMEAVAPEDRLAIRNFAAAKQAHAFDQVELIQAKLADLGVVAAMRGFAAFHPEMTPEQLAEAFLHDGPTTALLAQEFDRIRRKNGGDE